MKPLLVALPGNEALAAQLAQLGGWPLAECEFRRFPDGESYLRIASDCAGASVALLCTLDRPDAKLPALLFAAELARELGARRVGLVAPYLAYMRQDRRFRPGEAVTSRSFAALLSSRLDWLLTVDPHLHRHASLGEIYRLDGRALHAAPALADWIRAEIERPLLVGPDAESEQWVSEVAARVGAPFAVLEKERLGDRRVEIRLPDLTAHTGRTPVLLDDIVSSAHTLAQAACGLRAAGLPAPVCVVVHGLFAEGAERVLAEAGVARVVTSDSVPHATSRIALAPLLAPALAEALAAPTR